MTKAGQNGKMALRSPPEWEVSGCLVPMIQSGFQILTCQCWYLTGWSISSLHSPFWRLYCNMDGGAWVRQGGKGEPCDLEAGKVYLVPSETNLSSGLNHPVRHLFFHFLLEGNGADWARRLHCLPMDSATLGRLRALALTLLDHPLQDGENCPEAFATLGAVLSDHGLLPRARHSQHPGIGKLLQILEARNYPALDNREMAALAGMSTNALIRAFAGETGSTPQHWLRERRVIMACHRLIHTHDSIEQIAEAHGFANRFHFTRVFRAVRGTSPAAWRRECLRGMRAQSPPLGTTRISDDENPAAV